MAEFKESRLQQWAALADDIRTGVAELQEERAVPALMKVRTYANWIISALEEADGELADGSV